MSDAPPLPCGWRLEVHACLSSTNAECAARAQAGDPGDLAVLALAQTAPRATRGRAWSAPPGSLAVSALLRPGGRIISAWSLIAGLAAIEALATEAPGAPMSLKWPNDVLLAGAKLAGVLVEAALDADGRIDWVVAGIGANLAAAPDLPDRRAACLADYGAPPPERVARRIVLRLAHWQAVLARDGLGPVRDAWLARAHPAGTPLSVRAPGLDLRGDFAGLDAEGALLLRAPGGLHRVATGEVAMAGEG